MNAQTRYTVGGTGNFSYSGALLRAKRIHKETGTIVEVAIYE